MCEGGVTWGKWMSDKSATCCHTMGVAAVFLRMTVQRFFYLKDGKSLSVHVGAGGSQTSIACYLNKSVQPSYYKG
jgi:hypothetical protein